MTVRFAPKAAAAIAAALFMGSAFADPTSDFFVAITRDNANTVRSMLQDGFDPNTRNADGQPGLYFALRRESKRAAAVLVEAPTLDLNALSPAGESALMMTALRGDLAMSKRLIERGAAVNKDGWSPMHYAATGPDPDEIKLLLDQNANIDSRSPNGSTPLMMAAGYGPEANVDLLIFWGADLNRRNDIGLTAADFAKQAGRESLEARLRVAMAAKK